MYALVKTKDLPSLEDFNRYYVKSIVMVPHKREDHRMCPAIVRSVECLTRSTEYNIDTILFTVRRINNSDGEATDAVTYKLSEIVVDVKPEIGWFIPAEYSDPVWSCYRPHQSPVKGLYSGKIHTSNDGVNLDIGSTIGRANWFRMLCPTSMGVNGLLIDKTLIRYKGAIVGNITQDNRIVLHEHAYYLKDLVCRLK